MNNLSIKSKILLIVFVSLLCLSVTSVYILKGVLNSRSEAISNLSMSEDIIKQGEFIHELQKERGYSAAFMANGKDSEKNLKEQRAKVDGIVKELSNKDEVLRVLSGIRAKVDKKEKFNLLGEYSGMIENTLVFLNSLSKDAKPAIKDDVARIFSISKIKEYYGITRAIMNVAFIKDEIDKNTYVKLISHDANIKKLLNDYAKFNSGKYADSLQKDILQSNEFKQIDEIIKDAIASPEETSRKIEAASWFKTITNLIDSLRNYELYLLNDMKELATHDKDKASNLVLFMAIMLACFIVALVFISLVVGKNIISGIDSVKN